MYSVLIVDDHEVVRIGLKNHLSKDERLAEVNEAESAENAIEKTKNKFYDVIIMDVRLPDKSGVEACREVLENSPNSNVVMLTAFSDEDALIEAILAGASGYLLKEVKVNSLVETVIKAAGGASILDSKTTQKVMEHLRNKDSRDKKKLAGDLSEREKAILQLVSQGKTNKEIGNKLYISEKTVRNQLSKILNKLNLNNRAEAAAFYVAELKDNTTKT